MYERNAIILERYFDEMFGYNLKNNIKNNFNNYCELVDIQGKYKDITEEEEEIIIDYDLIANKIRDIQKTEQDLNKSNIKYQQQREMIFENIDEDANSIQKKLDMVNQNIQEIDIQIKENATKFINAVSEFSEKTQTRSKCGKNRRNIELEYNNMLNETLDNYRNIDIHLEQRAKQFAERDTADVEEELKRIIQENGKKEKIPFNKDAIEQAIKLSIDIQKRETDIFANSYEKTSKLFAEIKSNKIKIDMHKKNIIDSKSKQEFLFTLKEYLVQFLDNERLASVNGENEYNQLMKEACKNLRDDLTQINNLYTLLIKEITKKATKKMYGELYKIEYLESLKKKSEEFENQIKKLKLPVTIINPNYWRTEGMEKIYDVFNKCVTENYNRDLSEFITSNSEEDDEGAIDDIEPKDIEKISEKNEQKNNNKLNIKNLENEEQEYKQKEIPDDENKELDDVKSEIDKKIDLILGLNENYSDLQENDNTDIYDDEIYDDLDDFSDEKISKEEWDDIEDEKEKDDEELDVNEDDNWDEEELKSNNDDDWDEQEDEEIEQWEEDEEESDEEAEKLYVKENDDADYDIWGNNISKKNKKENDDWGEEFINIDKKEKKKKGFFDKFKK